MRAPPALARFLAGLGVDAEDRASALADLEHRYRRLVLERGRPAATRWYWWQAWRGLVHRFRPDLRDVRGWSPWRDIRQKARVLFRRPSYTAGVVGTLAVGLSSVTLVGTLAWKVWLSPMPFPEPDRVVRLFELEPPDPQAGPDATATRWRVSPPLLEDLRAHEWTTVSAVSAVSRNVADWTQDGEITRLSALAVSPDFFDVLGIRALHGRVLPDDPDAREVLLAEDLWRRAFGGDSTVVGRRSMILGGEDHRIVGVVDLPEAYPGAGDVVVPTSWSLEQLAPGMRGARYLDGVARLRPGADVDEASREMARLVEMAGREHPNNRGWSGEAAVLGDELLRPYREILGTLLAAGLVFLLLAVVNVAGLVAARTVEDAADGGIRLALGASRGRLLAESLVESVLLGASASLVALVLARWLLPAVRSLVPAEVPRVNEVALDWQGGVSLVVAGVVVGLVVGAASHLMARRGPLSIGRQAARSRGSRGRNAVVAGQVALTTLLATAGSGILWTSLTLQQVDLGFEASGVSSSQVMLTSERYPSPQARRVFWRTLLQEMEGRGLRAAVGTSPPMAGVNMPWGFRVDPVEEQDFAQYHIVSPGYFQIMEVDALEGRTFGAGDHEDAEAVVVINDVLAERYFPGQSAVGRRIEVVADWKTIVGVVRGVRHFGPDSEVPPEIYAPYTQDPWPHAQILASGEPSDVGGAVASAAETVDPNLGLGPMQPYGRFVAEWFAGLHLQLVVVGALAGVGTLLATLGLYALIAYRVSTGRREIGVRLALGASPRTVYRDVFRHGMGVAAAGLLVGLGLWYLAEPLAVPWTGEAGLGAGWLPLVVVLLVGATCAMATAVPARGSVRVDPARTLREE
ncbi:MAG: ABC transporter permease [Longimicrobiales bacterium]|nr:ABC transporter permease [Longimicrobiales bacterium]